jgi:polar amino acid transport system substrate-binding protein
LQRLYQKYGIWNETQQELSSLASTGDRELGIRATELGGWAVIRSRGWLLVEAAGMTILLACCAMPLAMALGLAVAVGRMFGPPPLRWLLVAYVEILRGTPLMLQLFVIFFLLPEIGIRIPAFYAAVAGLAINYSAYEAEIYRAGLQAVPRGQMEAALALGMSPALALRRIVIPQAVRIVIPPVTNDFIAMFKDTSVCSVITVMELTKQYSVQRNDTGATLELAALTALLYLLMSLPLSRLAVVLERRLARGSKHIA